LVPDKKVEQARFMATQTQLGQLLSSLVTDWKTELKLSTQQLMHSITTQIQQVRHELKTQSELLIALSPEAVLKRGYAILKQNRKPLTSATKLRVGSDMEALLHKKRISATIKNVEKRSVGETL